MLKNKHHKYLFYVNFELINWLKTPRKMEFNQNSGTQIKNRILSLKCYYESWYEIFYNFNVKNNKFRFPLILFYIYIWM